MVRSKRAGHDGTVADDFVRVWVVDDQTSFRRATAATLAAMDDFVMAGECDTGEFALDRIPDGGANGRLAKTRRRDRRDRTARGAGSAAGGSAGSAQPPRKISDGT